MMMKAGDNFKNWAQLLLSSGVQRYEILWSTLLVACGLPVDNFSHTIYPQDSNRKARAAVFPNPPVVFRRWHAIR